MTKVLEKTGWNKDEVDIFELNEAFAAQSLACVQVWGPSHLLQFFSSQNCPISTIKIPHFHPLFSGKFLTFIIIVIFTRVLSANRVDLGFFNFFHFTPPPQELGLDASKVNVNGGAIAIGHPIGCSGTRVLVTLIHAMKARGAKKGICSLCVGGGMGVAMALEM